MTPGWGVLGAVTLSSDDDRFGGYSGLDISADGSRLIAVSDRATWLSARLKLDEDGRLIGVSDAVIAEMEGQYGAPLIGGMGDAEAVARGPDGSLYVSFERFPRVLRYRAGEVRSLPRPKIWKTLQFNSSFETLFFTLDGVLAVAAERSGDVKRPYPGLGVHRWRMGTVRDPS